MSSPAARRLTQVGQAVENELSVRCPTCGGTKEERWCRASYWKHEPIDDDCEPCDSTFHDTTGER